MGRKITHPIGHKLISGGSKAQTLPWRGAPCSSHRWSSPWGAQFSAEAPHRRAALPQGAEMFSLARGTAGNKLFCSQSWAWGTEDWTPSMASCLEFALDWGSWAGSAGGRGGFVPSLGSFPKGQRGASADPREQDPACLLPELKLKFSPIFAGLVLSPCVLSPLSQLGRKTLG